MKFTNILLITCVLLMSCNKDKKLSKRLSGENWSATSLKISEIEETDLPEFSFDECDIYDENCTATWTLNGETANFIWQFRDKGTVFEISNQSKIDTSITDAIIQCMNLSGVYDVTESEKESLTITSSTTIGYTGDVVEMKLKKN